ncbi:MAG: secondary thiamine-phosphate synthase enzyme YjbQ [Desulfobulbales bacterium]|nr:secondary thiamine-phosphate synthase enzyme YjbQ [Desulfobulbales bacterium]
MGTVTIAVATGSRMEFVDITGQIQKEVSRSGIGAGVCYIYNPHTTAGLTINEGADPAVRDDIVAVLKKVIPFDYPYKHLEGNSPAHIMASLMGSSVTVFIEGGRLVLGTWQKIFFCEFDGPRSRKILCKLL